MRRTTWLAVIAIGLSLSACALAPSAAPTAAPTATESLTAAQTVVPPTPTATPSPSATLTSTQTPFLPIRALIIVNNVNLRTGPGYFFPILKSLPEGSSLTVLGKARGGEWFYVSATGRALGWVFGMLLDATHDLQEAPIIEPDYVLLIRGRVLDAKGTPIQGVVFNVVRILEQNTTANVVVTDPGGDFFSYLPADALGTWFVAHAGIACKSNVWKGPDCSDYKEGYTGQVEPLFIEVRLPFDGVLEFAWK